MTARNLEELRDFVRFTFKTYQDVMHAALSKGDIETVRTVLEEFLKSLPRFFEKMPMLKVRSQGYEVQLEQARSAREYAEADRGRNQVEQRLEVGQNLELAKAQIIFGLAARSIDLFLSAKDDKPQMLEAVRLFLDRLPINMQELVTLFSSIGEERASDAWGWHWWDFKPDGEVHYVDTFTRPNRTFIIQALKVLASQGEVPVPIPSEDSLFTYDASNQQGVSATLTQMEAEWGSFNGLVSDAERQQSARLRAMFENMKQTGEAAREQRLIAAPLDLAKVQEFRENVAAAFDKFSRVRLLMDKLSKVNDRTQQPAPPELRSWGYNQLDDKGAFIANWYVSYGAWGEAYGRGLAQAEDNRALEILLRSASKSLEVSEDDLIPEITKQLEARTWQKPIILQTLQTTLEYAQFRNNEHFIPRYRNDLPSIPESEIDGFMGVLMVAGEAVPVFDIFVQSDKLRDRLLIAELAKYAEWDRYSPLDEGGSSDDVFALLQIKVFDLNQDDDRRNRILQDAPDWLTDRGDTSRQEAYLRARVVVNVYDRFDLRILNPAAAVSLVVT